MHMRSTALALCCIIGLSRGFELTDFEKYLPDEVANFLKELTHAEMMILMENHLQTMADISGGMNALELSEKMNNFVKTKDPNLYRKMEDLTKALIAKVDRLSEQTKAIGKEILKELQKHSNRTDIVEMVKTAQNIIHLCRQAPRAVKKDFKRHFPNVSRLFNDRNFKRAMDMLVSKPAEELVKDVHLLKFSQQSYFNGLMNLNLEYVTMRPATTIRPFCRNPAHRHGFTRTSPATTIRPACRLHRVLHDHKEKHKHKRRHFYRVTRNEKSV